MTREGWRWFCQAFKEAWRDFSRDIRRAAYVHLRGNDAATWSEHYMDVESRRAYAAAYRHDVFRAVVALLYLDQRAESRTSRHDDADFTLWALPFAHIGALIAIMVGRGYKKDPSAKGYNEGYRTLLWYDFSYHYGGWSCKILEFNPRRFRFHVSSDGDTSM